MNKSSIKEKYHLIQAVKATGFAGGGHVITNLEDDEYIEYLNSLKDPTSLWCEIYRIQELAKTAHFLEKCKKKKSKKESLIQKIWEWFNS